MSVIANDSDAASRNRYREAPRAADYTIDQEWASYSAAEHDRWDRLFSRSQAILKDRACDEFLAAMDTLKLSEAGIPDMARLSDRLETITGWRVVPVAGPRARRDVLRPSGQPPVSGRRLHPPGSADGLSGGAGHLPRRVRPRAAAREPGVRRFHAGLRQGRPARADARLLKNLARLYWYTVEFGLIRRPGACASSAPASCRRRPKACSRWTDPSPNRIAFDLERVMRTKYIIDDFQQTYFVIDSFEELLADCYQDFGAALPTAEVGNRHRGARDCAGRRGRDAGHARLFQGKAGLVAGMLRPIVGVYSRPWPAVHPI